MTTYVALLRGINVGGQRKVEMARLKALFEELGFGEVRTYINSGNIIFRADEPADGLRTRIESAIERGFGFQVPVVLRSRQDLEQLLQRLPATWVNDSAMRCDVMFLWPEIDRPGVLEQIPHRRDIEDVVYFPGAVVWRVDRVNVRRGQVPKIVGSDTYRQMTARNVTTVRRLYQMMGAS
jgi:uncharacterized protein (DUF1697 family)